MRRLSRSLVVSLLVAIALMWTAGLALADVLAGSEDDSFVIEGSSRSGSSEGGVNGSQGVPATHGEPPAAPPPPGSYEPSWGARPDTGEPCIDLTYRSDVPPNSPLAIEWDVRTIDMTNDPRVDGAESALCQPDAVVATPVAAAEDFVRRIPLPEPRLQIDPGFALTGLPAYLVIDGQGSFAVDEDLAGWGTMRVDLRPIRFEVDWGDGTLETIADGRTGAGHGGDPAQQIEHVYRWADGDTVVTVRSDWEADWQVGGFAGTVAGLGIDAALSLPVREYRAVRTGR